MWFAILSLFAPVTVIGVLTEDGDEVCQKGEQRWVNLIPNVGWSTFHGVKPPAALMGKVVEVRGTPAERPPRTPAKSDWTCPPIQARGDWIRSRSGIRYDRDHKAPRAHLEAERVQAFEGLTLTRNPTGGGLDLKLHNAQPDAWRDITIALHYEGCYGKPGSITKTHAVPEIGGGQTYELKNFAPREMREHARGREHVLAYVQVVSKGPPVLDIDVSPAALGVPLRCTDREGRKRLPPPDPAQLRR